MCHDPSVTGDLIHPDLLRALRYSALVEDGGGDLAADELDAWMAAPTGKGLANWAVLGVPLDLVMEGATGYADYLALVGWVRFRPLRVTSVGRAVLNVGGAASAEAVDKNPDVIVLSPDDPMNAVKMTNAVAGARDGLLVDPYFEDELFAWLFDTTSIARVLTCRKQGDRRRLGLLLAGARSAGRSLEVRCLPPKALHDRYLVDGDGRVSMIGSSLNGLHANFTLVVPLPEPAAGSVRSFVDARWKAAERVEPAGMREPLLDLEP